MAHVTKMPDTFTAFFATPADETKDFKRPGGFSGKSVSPFYLVKRLTERFGLCGKGWKVKHYETREVKGDNGAVAVYVLLSLLYKEHGDNDWNEVGPHYGGDVAIDVKKAERQYKNADGTFNTLEVDDEAYKKAYTDAFSKCCSWLGLGGDIHDGMADGNKYIATKPWDVAVEESQNMTRKAKVILEALPSLEPDQARDAWTHEQSGQFSTLVDTDLYNLFKAGGHPEKFQAEAEKWRSKAKAEAAESVLPALAKRIELLQTAAAAAVAKKGKPDVPAEPEDPKPGTPEYAQAASNELTIVCGRFFAQLKEANPDWDEKKTQEEVKQIRNRVLATLTFAATATQDEKKMGLAIAMAEHAEKTKVAA